jgi:hypothetical protein
LSHFTLENPRLAAMAVNAWSRGAPCRRPTKEEQN